jgi:spore coat polysaccharide biosynthesis protein SpsF
LGVTATIVQARMGSTRLPGKVMRTLGHQTVLAHVLERCAAISNSDVVCCAVAEGLDNDAVADEARRCGAVVFRGSEKDVLARYSGAASMLGAEVVLRVTSDCPLIDPDVCAQVISLRERNGAAYACNNMPRSWPHGLDCEAMPRAWLERADREASLPEEREHVSPYLRNHPTAPKANLAAPVAGLAGHRWTLDTERDFRFFEALWERLPSGRDGWPYAAPLAVVEADPALAAMNLD